MKIAFVFPGQGAQYIGMAMDFVQENPELQAILDRFDKRNGTTLHTIMELGPEEELKQTRITQPAILFHSIAAWNALVKKYAITPTLVAGHSLGEITALVANGVLAWEDALQLVHKRGEFMIKANENTPYAMAAILGLEAEKVKEICEQASSEGVVIAANFNTPLQTVISGSAAGVEKAMELAKGAGAKRALPLVVGGPFHSPLIEKASAWLAEEMEQIPFRSTTIPVVSNVDALPTIDPGKMKANLAKQVTSSVRWVDCVNKMIEEGIDVFIEFGPQKVLSGMIKNIDKTVKVLNIDKLEDVETVIEELSNATS